MKKKLEEILTFCPLAEFSAKVAKYFEGASTAKVKTSLLGISRDSKEELLKERALAALKVFMKTNKKAKHVKNKRNEETKKNAQPAQDVAPEERVTKEAVLIISACRTPIGCYGGSLSEVPAVHLGAIAIRAAIEKAMLNPAKIEEIYMGSVLQANLGTSPAKQAALRAGCPETTDVTTINKASSSGLKAGSGGLSGEIIRLLLQVTEDLTNVFDKANCEVVYRLRAEFEAF